jgi:Fe-S oxidoreductase
MIYKTFFAAVFLNLLFLAFLSGGVKPSGKAKGFFLLHDPCLLPSSKGVSEATYMQ